MQSNINEILRGALRHAAKLRRHRAKRPRETTTCVPVVVVESHSRGCEAYHALVRRGVVPVTPVTVLHVDSHPDMMLPTIPFRSYGIDTNGEEEDDGDDQSASEWCESLYTYLDSSTGGIAEWLLPLCYQGHVGRLVWLRASWCDQLKDGATRGMRVGRVGEGMLKLWGTSEPYFVDEGLVIDDPSSFLDSRMFDLVVGTSTSNGEGGASAMTGITQGEAWVLDVCLDYFAVTNPFFVRFEKAVMGEESAMGEEGATGEISSSSREQRKKAVEICERWFRHVDIAFAKGEKDAFAKEVVMRVLGATSDDDGLKSDDDSSVKFAIPSNAQEDSFASLIEALRVVRGRRAASEATTYLSNAGLPHHPVFEPRELERFETFLRGLPPPAAVMIARSEADEYTPRELVESIEKDVTESIRRVWGQIDFLVVGCDSVN